MPAARQDPRFAALGDTQSDAIGLRGSIASLTGTEPFGLFAFRAPEGILWQKWRALEAEFAADLEGDRTLPRRRAQCTPAARRLVALVDTLKERDGRARLDAVNRAVNEAIRYQSDMQQFGEADRWLSPLAAFTSRLGDCEDYVIAKYFALREAGFPLVDLRFVLVRDRKARDDHAVLAARDDGHWLILDNRHHALDHDTSLAHLTPLFAINHEGVKLVAAPYLKPQATAGRCRAGTLARRRRIRAARLGRDRAGEWRRATRRIGRRSEALLRNCLSVMAGLVAPQIHQSSWPGLIRPSTSSIAAQRK